ncbi:MAG: EAL domain-containing protein [Pseudomonadota bacterium]
MGKVREVDLGKARSNGVPILWKTSAVAVAFFTLLIANVVGEWLTTREQDRMIAEWQTRDEGLSRAYSALRAELLQLEQQAFYPGAAEAPTLRGTLLTPVREHLAVLEQLAPTTMPKVAAAFEEFESAYAAATAPQLTAPQHQSRLNLSRARLRLVETTFSGLRDAQASWSNELARFQEVGRVVRKLLLAVLLLAGAAAAAVLIQLALRMQATVRAIVIATEKLTKGETDPERVGLDIDLTSRDEIGRLGRSLDSLIGFVRDVTAARDELRSLSVLDPLTALPNRRGLDEMLSDWLTGPDAIPVLTAMHIDLDHFKAVNDTLGHDAGDHVLKVAADRMRAAIRSEDIVARVGGDEFVVLLPDLDDLGRLAQIAIRIISSLSEPISHQDRICQIGGSIGIAIGGTYHGIEDPEELLKAADLAVFKSKANGRGKFSVFDKNMRAFIEHQRAMAKRLGAALQHNQIEAWLQPVLDVERRRLVSVEALARWRDPELGLISAEDFIEIAKQRNMIVDIRTVVMARASRAVAEWIEAGYNIPQLTFNISTIELKSVDLVDEVKWALEHAQLDPNRVAVELNAQIAQDRSVEVAMGQVERLLDLGVGIVMDNVDFDNPSSSDLQRFGVRLAKLDPKMIEALDADPEQAIRLSRLIELMGSVQVNVFGKAVTSDDLAEQLRIVGCSGLQGHFIAPPMALDDFGRWLEEFGAPEAKPKKRRQRRA